MHDLKKFSEKQYLLVRSAWPLLKSGGKLLYVTCSIFSDENRDVIERFKQEFSDAKEIDLIYPNQFSTKAFVILELEMGKKFLSQDKGHYQEPRLSIRDFHPLEE